MYSAVNEFVKSNRVAIIGSGSWATALAKILMNNVDELNWYFHKQETIDNFKKTRSNKYLRAVRFDLNRINFYSDINKIVQDSDILLFATPSVYLKETTGKLTVDISSKFILSAIKGIVPGDNLLVGEFFNQEFNVPVDSFGVISGPCHAEEVARELLSYLTVACTDLKQARAIAQLLTSSYSSAHIVDDTFGVQYSSVLKNVISIASGIAQRLRYGDNFQAVLISNGISEIERFVDTVNPMARDVKSSVYLGDLLVTGYSQFSRNRTFGMMIGMGYSTRSAILEMNMVAEGYYAAKCIKEINDRYNVNMPITDAVYNILYDGISPTIEIQLLSKQLI